MMREIGQGPGQDKEELPDLWSLVEGDMTDAFRDRGRVAGALVLATLTETNYSPTIGGETITRPAETEAEQESMGRAALLLLQAQEVPRKGIRPVSPKTYETGYRGIWRLVRPRRGDSYIDQQNFAVGLQESGAVMGIRIRGIEQAGRIVEGAPPALRAIPLDDLPEQDSDNLASVRLVTDSGRLIWAYGRQRRDGPDLWLPRGTDALRSGKRLGRPAGELVNQVLPERLAELMTKHARR